MQINQITAEARQIRNNLKATNDFPHNPISLERDPIPPYPNQIEKVKLIIIGQDPTIRNLKSRGKITYTLNLDKGGSLQTYIKYLCKKLNVQFEEIYATNIFKYFYSIPPADTMDVLQAHLNDNLVLLRKEIALFPDAKIVTLGQPVLQLLSNEKELVRNYWGYGGKSNTSNGKFSSCESTANKLGRAFYPLPHQPSIRKEFYKNNIDSYLDYVKSSIG